MPHFKAFQAAAANGLGEVERQINGWMDAERPRILFYAQGTQGNTLLFTFVYELAQDALGALAKTATAEVPEGIEHSLESIDLDPSDTEITFLPEAELPY